MIDKIDINGNHTYLKLDQTRNFLLKMNSFVTSNNIKDLINSAVSVEKELSYIQKNYGDMVYQECNICYLNLRRAKVHYISERLDVIDKYILENYNNLTILNEQFKSKHCEG